MFLFWKLYSTASFVSTPVPCHSNDLAFFMLLLIVFGRLGSTIRSLLLLRVLRQRQVGGYGLTLPTTPLFPIEPSPAQDGTDKNRRWQDRTDEVQSEPGVMAGESYVYDFITILFYLQKVPMKCKKTLDSSSTN